MKIAIIFGGTGYIGGFLLRKIIEESIFQKVYICDLKPVLGFDDELRNGKVVYKQIDVRETISLHLNKVNKKDSWIFNLAAIHREPGHEYKEYFDTNIPGAENINEFARRIGVNNMLFTSSIAPYGKSLEQRSEASNLYPETAYGISKALAEKIHEQWLVEDRNRRLIIVRPSVIFGPNDPGNVYRMIKALKKGTFVLPDGGKVIKGYGYVYGLVESFLFVMAKKDRLIIYNYAENPLISLREMVVTAKKELNYNKPTIKMSIKFLSAIAGFIQIVFKIVGKKSDIHPVRVRKAGFPTNIKPQYLIDNGFEFKYDFLNAIKHWKECSPEDF